MKNFFTSVCRQLLLLLYSMICFGLAQAQSPPKADTLPNGVIVNKAALNDLAKSLEIQNKTELAVAQKLLDGEKKAGIKPKKPFRRTSILAGLDPVGRPLFYHTKDVAQAVSINTSKAWAGGGLGYDLSGRNVRMAVWEPGIARVTHQEFGGRAVWADPTTGYSGLAVNQDDHATHVSGIMAAGAAVARAKGMAYRCSLRVFSANNDVAEMTAEAALGLLVSNHSYGPDYGWIVYTTGTVPDTLVWQWDGDTTVNYNFDWRHGYYDAKSRNVDQVCVNAPYYLPFIAAGNETGAGPHKTYGFPAARRKVVYRNGTSRIPPARYPPKDTIDNISGFTLAKNPIVIGSVDSLPPNHAVPLAGGVRSDFSCIGPADDGRIKPDVCAHGRNVYSAFKANNTSYGFMSGTSQASPSGAGSGAMLQEHYRNIYSSYMRAPTLKGLIIHTADESGANPGPDYYMGYGVMNTGKAASVISGSRTSQKHKILEKTLANGIRDTIKGLITKGGANNPIRVTLSWYDTQIAPLPANRLDSIKSHLVADLDVRMVRKSDGKLYLPWVLDGRRPNRTNPARKGNDTVNVVEVIDTNVAPAGEYYVVVSHKRTLAGPQPYSLIITGFGDTIQASQSTLGNSLVGRVQLSNLDNNSFPAACNSYSDFTYLFANLCSGKKYKIKVSTGTCVSSATKIIKAYLD